ncbi:MAG: hypothetical protein AAF447_11490 [Myxococcota bacterium]
MPSADAPALFSHAKRREWGLGLVLKKREDRVRVQFEDGRQRRFKRGWYHLLEPADRRHDEALDVAEALREMAGETKPTGNRKRPIALEEQLAYFRELFADGFGDDDYVIAHRGDGRKRPLLCHRDALVAAGTKMREAVRDSDAERLMDAATTAVTRTDLIASKERKSFAAMEASGRAAVAEALFAVAKSRGALVRAFDGLVKALERALGQTPSWALVTLLLAAPRPDARLVVLPRIAQAQARWMAPGLTVGARPLGALYARLETMALRVRADLEEAGLAPKDLFDVVQLMKLTLGPTAQKRIRDRRGTDDALADLAVVA